MIRSPYHKFHVTVPPVVRLQRLIFVSLIGFTTTSARNFSWSTTDSWNKLLLQEQYPTETPRSDDNEDSTKDNMGQVMRTMTYDRAANERNAIASLDLAGQALHWFRLDDGVMGGMSETQHVDDDGVLHFTGTINTSGGGFTSIRSKVPPDLPTTFNTEAVRIRFRGDGKTYKFLLSDGKRMTGTPMSRSPSWQADVPTRTLETDEWEETIIPLASLQPVFSGSPASRPSDTSQYQFHMNEMAEMGLMLSLRLASGKLNPKETFGEGIFPFSLQVKSIEMLAKEDSQT